MRALLRDIPATELAGLRRPTEDDVDALGGLMYRAYAGTIDYDGETAEEALAEVRRTFVGEYGAFDPAHSTVAKRSGRLVSATLVTHWQERPFVAFTMTDPAFARQGLARATLERSMHLLRQSGETELRLVVTIDNEPARLLYESLGFVREP
ncbi:GNAT family N-acetyltransferase [Aquabacterium humicola]|uniref:GNAT family N-acetyltransferase n=1 Tax=Aquabacterium humicola TaxID=3237377 RepID=UPI002543FB35|nr:GNAT family N-acetyltransferase [Rubrivivax pictus]